MKETSKDSIVDLILKKPDEFEKHKTTPMDLTEVDFLNFTLENVNFHQYDLTGSSFGEAHLTEINFSDSDLTCASFVRSNIVECDFSNSNLNGCDFSSSSVEYCNFQDAQMSGCTMFDADFSNCDLSGALNLEEAKFDESTIWPDSDRLPSEFEGRSNADLSSLQDDDEMQDSIEDY